MSALIYVETPFRFRVVYRIYIGHITSNLVYFENHMKMSHYRRFPISYYWNQYALCRVHVRYENNIIYKAWA